MGYWYSKFSRFARCFSFSSPFSLLLHNRTEDAARLVQAGNHIAKGAAFSDTPDLKLLRVSWRRMGGRCVCVCVRCARLSFLCASDGGAASAPPFVRPCTHWPGQYVLLCLLRVAVPLRPCFAHECARVSVCMCACVPGIGAHGKRRRVARAQSAPPPPCTY